MTAPILQFITLRTLYNIFYNRKSLFFGIVVVIVGSATIVWFVRPVGYSVSVLLDIARIGTEVQTQDYTYDKYYRLQADEQFGETVSHWLRTPRVVDDILQTATIPLPQTLRERERFFQAHRISPQSIAVTYSAVNPLIGTRIADAMNKQLNSRVAALNYGVAQEQWFVIQVSEPVIARNHKPLWLVLFVAGVVGVFVGSCTVLLLYALRGQRNNTQKKNRHSKR